MPPDACVGPIQNRGFAACYTGMKGARHLTSQFLNGKLLKSIWQGWLTGQGEGHFARDGASSTVRTGKDRISHLISGSTWALAPLQGVEQRR